MTLLNAENARKLTMKTRKENSEKIVGKNVCLILKKVKEATKKGHDTITYYLKFKDEPREVKKVFESLGYFVVVTLSGHHGDEEVYCFQISW